MKGNGGNDHLMTTPQAKTTEMESFPPVMLFTTAVEYKLN